MTDLKARLLAGVKAAGGVQRAAMLLAVSPGSLYQWLSPKGPEPRLVTVIALEATAQLADLQARWDALQAQTKAEN